MSCYSERTGELWGAFMLGIVIGWVLCDIVTGVIMGP